MRQFYQCFPFCHALSDKLTWTHWRTLLKVQDETVRNFYLTECISGNWSVRQLERQINTLFYERMLASKDQKTVREEIQRSVPQALEPKEIVLLHVRNEYRSIISISILTLCSTTFWPDVMCL